MPRLNQCLTDASSPPQACGLSGLAAGMAIGIVGDTLTRASAVQPKLFVGMVRL